MTHGFCSMRRVAVTAIAAALAGSMVGCWVASDVVNSADSIRRDTRLAAAQEQMLLSGAFRPLTEHETADLASRVFLGRGYHESDCPEERPAALLRRDAHSSAARKATIGSRPTRSRRQLGECCDPSPDTFSTS